MSICGKKSLCLRLTDVYFESAIPPALLEAKQMAVNDKVKIHIPIGSLDAYQHSVWKDWNFVEDQPHKPLV